MKKLEIIYKSGGTTSLKNTSRRFTNSLVRRYIREYCHPMENVRMATLYTYPIKYNEPLVLIENGQLINEI